MLPQEETVDKLTDELRISGDEVIERVRQQLARMTHKSLEILSQKAKATTDECRSELTKILELAVSQSKDEALNAIGRAAEEAIAQLRSGQDTALRDFEQEATGRLGELVDAHSVQFEHNLSAQGEEQSTVIAAQLSEKLRIAGNAAVDEAENNLASVTKASLDAVTQATAKEYHSQLGRTFREQSETVSRAADAALISIKLAAEKASAEFWRQRAADDQPH